MSQEQESDPQVKNPKAKKPPFVNWIYGVLLIVFGAMMVFGGSSLSEITWKEFEQDILSQGDVERVDVINNERVEVYILEDRLSEDRHKDATRKMFGNKISSGPHYYFNIGSVEVFEQNLDHAQRDIPEKDQITITYSKRENWLGNILAWLLPFGLLVFFWIYMTRRNPVSRGGSSMFTFGQSKARLMEKGEKSQITFADVAGIKEAKEEIYELVSFLKKPERYRRLGAKIPKGILLVGPPGTGKTLLAKAVAGEAGVPFFSLSGSEFIEMFVGVGAARMRDLFQKAKAKAPSIIFIDEIDTIGRARGGARAFQSNDERESTLNQLLAELDGFDTGTGVIVLAATNRGDILDPALLRPGRFDRHIHLELPSIKEREAIFKVHMKPLKLAEDADPVSLAQQTPGFSGADIANICNEAALIAARGKKESVEKKDFTDAIDRVVGGLEKRSKIMSPDDKKRVAYHEAGHVTVGWFLENHHPAQKVSIIPRGRSLGAAWYLPEEHHVITRSEFFDTLCIVLGGRAAEDLVFSEVSSNALDDLEKVTKQAYTMVAHYALSDELRNISYYDSTGRSEQALHKPYSEKTAEKIDLEVQQIVDEAYTKTKNILLDHYQQLEALANALVKKELIQREEIEGLMGDQLTMDQKPVSHTSSP